MPYMIARQNVTDFDQWKQVFDSHAEAQEKSGLNLQHVLRNMNDPNDVFAIFEVSDLDKARGFVTSPEVPEAKAQSGVIGETEIILLE